MSGGSATGERTDSRVVNPQRRTSPLTLRMAEGLALICTRRHFLRWMLERAFVLGTSAALVDSLFADYAAASHYGCGPQSVSPRCSCCSEGQCGSGCSNRPYATSSCGSGPNCWIYGNLLCCDCCCPLSCIIQSDCSAPGHSCGACKVCTSLRRCTCFTVCC